MNKSIVIAIVCLAAGAAGGVVTAQISMGAALEETQQANEALKERLDSLSASTVPVEKARRLEEENKALRSDTDRLRERLAQLERVTASSEEPGEDAEDLWGSLLASVQPAELDDQAQEDAGQQPNAAMARGRGGDDPRAQWQNMSPEEREERRQMFVDRARNHIYERFNEAFEEAKTPAQKERITQLQQNLDYMMTLRDEMASAETDEDRQYYRSEVAETQRSIRSLLEEERMSRLRDVAQSYGVSDAEQQNAFIRDLESVQENSVFRLPMRVNMSMGRRGGFAGGGGPPRGGGGGPAGQR